MTIKWGYFKGERAYIVSKFKNSMESEMLFPFVKTRGREMSCE